MADYICLTCGYEGKPRRIKRGSAAMEWGIWLSLMVPGPFYSFYRRYRLPAICPNCKSPNMASLKSDAGQLAMAKFNAELGIIPVKPREDKMVLSDASFSTPALAPDESKPKKPVDPDLW